jgi:hypothetical protein
LSLSPTRHNSAASADILRYVVECAHRPRSTPHPRLCSIARWTTIPFFGRRADQATSARSPDADTRLRTSFGSFVVPPRSASSPLLPGPDDERLQFQFPTRRILRNAAPRVKITDRIFNPQRASRIPPRGGLRQKFVAFLPFSLGPFADFCTFFLPPSRRSLNTVFLGGRSRTPKVADCCGLDGRCRVDT